MTKTLLAALVVALSGCSSMEVTVLFGPRSNRDYTELAGSLSVIRRLPGRKVCGYTHQSDVFSGEPFRPERPEVQTDMLGCGIRWSKP